MAAIEIKGKKFSRTKTGEVQFHVTYHCESEEAALYHVPTTYLGLKLDNLSGSEWDGGSRQYLTTGVYIGVPADAPEPEEFDTFDFDGEYREEPIETFPRRDLLISVYGAYLDNGKLKFPEVLPVKSRSRSTRAGAEQQNPMNGVESYPVDFFTARQTMVRKVIPSEVFREKGTIVASLPSGFDYSGEGDAWFVDAPRITSRGNVKQIVRTWKELPGELDYWRALRVLLQNG